MLTSPNAPLVAASSIALCHKRDISAQLGSARYVEVRALPKMASMCQLWCAYDAGTSAVLHVKEATHLASPSDNSPCLQSQKLGRPE